MNNGASATPASEHTSPPHNLASAFVCDWSPFDYHPSYQNSSTMSTPHPPFFDFSSPFFLFLVFIPPPHHLSSRGPIHQFPHTECVRTLTHILPSFFFPPFPTHSIFSPFHRLAPHTHTTPSFTHANHHTTSSTAGDQQQHRWPS